jgi:hypothetical protein
MGTKRDNFDQIPALNKVKRSGIYIHRKKKKIRDKEHLEDLKTCLGPIIRPGFTPAHQPSSNASRNPVPLKKKREKRKEDSWEQF